ncbi:MAG: aminopeptidase [Catalinimonas sp.]
MLKKILIVCGVVVVGLSAAGWPMLRYGWGQLHGQLHIIRNARPVETFLQDPAFPDSLKARLRLVREVRRYAVDSLGLNESENYTTLYDQRGEPVLWNVTAARPFKMEAKEWHFPFLGSFSYKGFFDRDWAEAEAEAAHDDGWETRIYPVGGWSTLGWFKDPILSNMLTRSEGALAELIIHELTHGTLYVKNEVTYNENLATFVGEEGARRFLAQKYGDTAEVYRRYVSGDEDYRRFADHILRGGKQLDSLYGEFTETMTVAEKQSRKEAVIRGIVARVDTIGFAFPERYRRRFQGDKLPNNTLFLSFQRYREAQNQFADEFEEEFGGDFPRYMAHLKKKYPSL